MFTRCEIKYVRWIGEAKKAETREMRIAKTLEKLS